MMPRRVLSLLPLAFGVVAGSAAAQSPAPAQVAGCVLNAKVPDIRRMTETGKPPLLVLDGAPSGPLFFDRETCLRVDPGKVTLSDVRVLRASAAVHLYGEAGKNGAVVVTCGGCGTPAGQDFGARSPVTRIREIRLEESASVLNVTPIVRPDPRGGYLVSDVSEAQIRRYDENGRLLWHVGRKGHGPSEFQAPQIALRLPGGNVFVADRDAKIAIFDSTATHLVKSFLVPLERMEDGAVLNDSLVVCSGTGGDATPHAFLHIVNLNTESVTRSFFRPFARYPYPDLAVVFSSVVLAVNGNEIAAAALPLDTVYFFSSAGESLRRIPFPGTHFRMPKPIRGDFRNPRKRSEWLGSFETVTGLYWMGQDTVLVPFRTIVDNTTSRWHLLAMTTSGKKVFEWMNGPELLGADGDSGTLVFRSPRSLTPNVWSIARLSPPSP